MPSQTRRIGWLTAMLALTATTVGLVLHYRGGNTRAATSASKERMAEATRVNADELEQLKNAVRALDRKSTALELRLAAAQAQLAANPAAPASGSADADAAKVQDGHTELELRQSALANLDAALIADRGDVRDHVAARNTLSRNLTEAAGGKARINSVQCGSDFCKAVLEEDMSSGQRLDMIAILALPALKTETLLDYRKEGSRKITTVYAAREGLSLPLPREPFPERTQDRARQRRAR